MRPRFLRRLRDNERGSTITEMGLIAPVFFALLMGGFDLGHTLYLKSVLNGALTSAARSGTLEAFNSNPQVLDQYVKSQTLLLNKSAKIEFRRRNYKSFSDLVKPEDFTDTNDNGVFDAGQECFVDSNGNGNWDFDGAAGDGQGGANDIVMYDATVTYDALFPLWKLIGQTKKDKRVVSTTVLQNQPFKQRTAEIADKRICPK